MMLAEKQNMSNTADVGCVYSILRRRVMCVRAGDTEEVSVLFDGHVLFPVYWQTRTPLSLTSSFICSTSGVISVWRSGRDSVSVCNRDLSGIISSNRSTLGFLLLQTNLAFSLNKSMLCYLIKEYFSSTVCLTLIQRTFKKLGAYCKMASHSLGQ